MKNRILILGIIAAMFACKKEEPTPEPTPPTIYGEWTHTQFDYLDRFGDYVELEKDEPYVIEEDSMFVGYSRELEYIEYRGDSLFFNNQGFHVRVLTHKRMEWYLENEFGSFIIFYFDR